jgi:hypothetical protein
MTMQATLDFDVGDKANVTFNAAGFTVTGINQICIYVNLVTGQSYRDNELWNTLERIAETIREQAAQFQTASAPVYFQCVLGGPKSQVNNQPNVASIVAGEVGIGLGQNASWTSTSEIANRIKEIMEAMWEKQRKYA